MSWPGWNHLPLTHTALDDRFLTVKPMPASDASPCGASPVSESRLRISSPPFLTVSLAESSASGRFHVTSTLPKPVEVASQKNVSCSSWA